jgi:hypothetical protein
MFLSYACLPPSILLLGASRPEISPLRGDLNWAIPLLRLTHLLDARKVGAGRLLNIDVRQTDGRALGGTSWEAVVFELMDTSPLIVVDTRVATPAVLEETILAFQYPHKSLFVVGADGSSQVFALLSQKLGFIPPAIEVVTDAQARSVAKELLRGGKRPGGGAAGNYVNMLERVGASAPAVAAALKYQRAGREAGGPARGSVRRPGDFSRDPARFEKYRDGFTPKAGPLLSYRDDLLQFSFILPEGWAFGRRLAPFGCVVVSKHGPLVVQAEEVEDRLTDRAARKTDLLDRLRARGCAGVTAVQEGRTFAGEENVIFYAYEAPNRSRGFGVSVVRNGVQYSIEAEGFPDRFLRDTFAALESSFRFATGERVNYLKTSQADEVSANQGEAG